MAAPVVAAGIAAAAMMAKQKKEEEEKKKDRQAAKQTKIADIQAKSGEGVSKGIGSIIDGLRSSLIRRRS